MPSIMTYSNNYITIIQRCARGCSLNYTRLSTIGNTTYYLTLQFCHTSTDLLTFNKDLFIRSHLKYDIPLRWYMDNYRNWLLLVTYMLYDLTILISIHILIIWEAPTRSKLLGSLLKNKKIYHESMNNILKKNFNKQKS